MVSSAVILLDPGIDQYQNAVVCAGGEMARKKALSIEQQEEMMLIKGNGQPSFQTWVKLASLLRASPDLALIIFEFRANSLGDMRPSFVCPGGSSLVGFNWSVVGLSRK